MKNFNLSNLKTVIGDGQAALSRHVSLGIFLFYSNL